MHTPSHWYPTRASAASLKLAALALSPLGAAYDFAGIVRRSLATPYKSAIPVICIGNVTAGGTGKTPLAITIASKLIALGYSVHFLTRGYGGSARGPLLVDLARHGCPEVGDEALLLAAVAPTWVSHRRVEGARAAERAGARIIVMDDGFQNPALVKTLSILVVDSEAGFGNGHIIPAGPLRERVGRALKRADAVVLMGDEQAGVPKELASWRGPLFKARLEPPPNCVAQGRYLAFAGIGRPEKFFATLEAAGAMLADRVAFPDHHVYLASEMEALKRRAAEHSARLITTAKDAARLHPQWRTQVDVLPVAARFCANEAFGSFLMEHLASALQIRRNADAL